MAKKSFSGGLNSLLGGEPITVTTTAEKKEVVNDVEFKRHTLVAKVPILNKIKAIAYWERRNIQDVINDALEAAVMSYETQNGIIKEVKR